MNYLSNTSANFFVIQWFTLNSSPISLLIWIVNCFSLQRNRLLIIPWLINSFISLLFNAVAIGFTLSRVVQQNSANYSAVIPFAVAAAIIFGKTILININIMAMNSIEPVQINLNVFILFDYFQQFMCMHTWQFTVYTKKFAELHQTVNIPVWLTTETNTAASTIPFIRVPKITDLFAIRPIDWWNSLQ